MGGMASEWSELLMWKPLMSVGEVTMANDSYCSQRVPSGEAINPVVQAHVFWFPGLARHRWGQPPLFQPIRLSLTLVELMLVKSSCSLANCGSVEREKRVIMARF